MITGEQIKAARELLGLRPSRLADRARVTTGMVRRAEGKDNGTAVTPVELKKIQAALEFAGVEFTDSDPGVRLRKTP